MYTPSTCVQWEYSTRYAYVLVVLALLYTAIGHVMYESSLEPFFAAAAAAWDRG